MLHLAFLIVAIIVAVLALGGLYVFWVEPLWFLPLLERLTPEIVYRVRTKAPLVALSFDDGPHAVFTPQVLEILERHGAKATFFLIGERALREPKLVERIRAAGHEIGNHYLRNGPALGHSDEEFARNLLETERAIEGRTLVPPPDATERASLSGSRPERHNSLTKLFRPPGGVASPRQLRAVREHGYTCVLGCAYPHDPMRPPVGYIRWLIGKNLCPGTIVILHDGIADARRGIAALPHILEAGHRKGLRFVSIEELVRRAGE